MNRTELEAYRAYLLRNITRFNGINTIINSSYPSKRYKSLDRAKANLKEANRLMSLAIRDYEEVLLAVEAELK